MWFKVVIIFVLLGFIVSLTSGFFFLMKDQETNKKRVFNSLSIRLALAVLLIALLTYGAVTGKLHSQAPWSLPMTQLPSATTMTPTEGK